MSIPVKPEDLAEALRSYPFGYLVTVGQDGRPHVVAVSPSLRQGALHVEDTGRRTRANAAARPDVTLVHPPASPGGYSLIVDGRAEVADDVLLVSPSSAGLHRPASHGAPSSETGCGADCRPVASLDA
jgi:hypothetical protein